MSAWVYSTVACTRLGTARSHRIFYPRHCRRNLATAKKEIRHLRDQLKMQEALPAIKDEPITLLRIAFDRAN